MVGAVESSITEDALHYQAYSIGIRGSRISRKHVHGDWAKMEWKHTASRYKMMQIGRTFPCGVPLGDEICTASGWGVQGIP